MTTPSKTIALSGILRSFAVGGFLALAWLLAIPMGAEANNPDLTNFGNQYPTAPARIKVCALCHVNIGTGVRPLTAYGVSYCTPNPAPNGPCTTRNNARFPLIENLDSDGDGWKNLAEINAGFFPGSATDEPAAGVAIDPTIAQQSGNPNTAVIYNLTVRNTSLATDSFTVTRDLTGQSWTTTLSVNSIADLAGQNSVPLTVTVQVPPGATAGQTSTATVRVTSAGNPAIFATAVLTTCAQGCNPVPQLLSLAPPEGVTEGGPAFVLTVTGGNFLNTSVVRWNGADRPTTFFGDTELRATIPSSDILSPGTAQVTVFTPPPAGGLSNPLFFLVGAVGSRSWASVGGLSAFVFNAVAADPANGALVFAGGSGAGSCRTADKVAGCDVYRSTDGGQTWAPVTEEINRLDVAALAVGGSRVFANAIEPDAGFNDFHKVLRSLDGGATWTEVHRADATGEVNLSIAVDPSDPNTVYAGDFGPLGSGLLFKSSSGGDLGTWSRLPEIFVPGGEIHAYAIAVDPQVAGTLYASGTGTPNLAKSIDGGLTWTSAAVPGVANFVYSLAIHPTTSSTLYAGTFDQGVFRSTNGGATWAAKSAGFPTPFPSINALVVDPLNPQVIHAGTSLGYFFSIDGGESWTAINTGLPTPDARSIKGLALTPARRLVAATAGGLFLLDLSPDATGFQGSVFLSVSQPTLRGGDTLSVNLSVVNPGAAAVVDVFFGIILPPSFAAAFGCPAGSTPIAFIVTGSVIVKCPSDSPSTFPRFVAGVTVPGGLPLTTVPGFFTAPLPPGMPTGTYLVFFALARRGAFLDGTFDADDVLAGSQVIFVVVP